MPGAMNGIDLARHVHKHWPWVALLATLGHARLSDDNIPDGGRFLKYFTIRITLSLTSEN